VFLIAARRTSVDVGPGGSLWFWLYAPNVLIQVRNHLLPYILNVTWSLGVEEQFYLVWPWVVAALDRRRLARLCIATFGLVLLARFAVAFLGSDAAPFAVRMIAQRGFDTLSLGALVAIMLREPSLATQLVALARRALLPMSVLAAAYLATTFFEVSSYASVVGLEVFELWLAVLVTFAAACPGNSRIGQFFDSPVLRNFGKYSYGLYLIHVPIDIFVGNSNHVGVARFATHLGSPVVGFALYATFLIAVSYVAARASWFLFESRFLGLKRFFEYEATPLRSDAATATERA